MIRIRWSAPVTALALAACTATETPERMEARMRAESDSARAAITEHAAAMMRWIQNGHADSAAAIYAENARLHPANEPTVTGREAIRRKFEEWLAMGSWTYAIRTMEVVANGPLAVEWGTYVADFTPGPNAPPGMAAMFPDSGKYMVHWHRINGRWMIVDDIGNTSRPMAPPPTAAAGRRRS
jgi:ketosteroid isomerase-like protein